MHTSFSTKMSKPAHPREGVSLVEILVVTVVISLMAAISFPVFKIVQQREKERRLRIILYDVRTAISGSKSALSSREFTDGYRTFVTLSGLAQITDDASKTLFLNTLANDGYGFPGTMASLTTPPFTFDIPISAIPGDIVAIKVDRKFLRPRPATDDLPPHPFTSWNPNATWTKVLKNGNITDIRSDGAGLALNGSITDDW
ncbi:MAG: prepilin-type N-terminal cleavage/methylation domain-containing protein [Candidatus Riflebacteria bacterium]|nr:prepilin-type N-terminal cleavage/methylation domain-containing protein [Candidatus Riflebacteria bacterium]